MANDLTQSDREQLGQITTRDEAGRHFTEVYDANWLSRMEDAGYIEIHRPVHESGTAYGQEEWQVAVADEVAEWFESDGSLAECYRD